MPRPYNPRHGPERLHFNFTDPQKANLNKFGYPPREQANAGKRGNIKLASPTKIAVLIVAITTVIAVAASNLVIYVTDLLLPGFEARFDNYAFSTGIPLAVSPLLIAPLAYAIYRLTQLKAELERSVRTDALTGLLNRRGFFERAEDAFRQDDVRELPIALMMVDVDRFKEANDALGHAFGDDLLRHIARSIDEAVAGSSPHNVVARIGGDEFAVLLAGPDATAASAAAERVCRSVRGQIARHDETVPAPSVSVGLAKRIRNEPLDSTMKAADDAAYQAKRAGRDRWVLAAPVGEPAPPDAMRAA